MNKILYLCNEEIVYTYKLKFDKNYLKEQIENLLNKNLEEHYIENNVVHSNYNKYTNIQSSYDLVVFLKQAFLENNIINLTEIKNLIISNNSRIRTPQTINEISKILGSIEYELQKKEDVKKINLSTKAICRNILIKYIENNDGIIDIAIKNDYVYKNLQINLPKEIENKKTKTITKM